jgi:CRISPR/Cas system-associated exonuclease Cas4 (RecB family)
MGVRSYLPKSNSLKKIKWSDFVKSALPASTIAEYWYCPVKIYNKIRLGDIKTPNTIAGSQIHEEEAQEVLKQLGPMKKVKIQSLFDAMLHSYRNLTIALKEKQILANSEKSILFRCIVPETGYIGLPDIADCINGKQPILVEVKTTGRIPKEVWMSHRIQIGVYIIGLERLSLKPEYGIVEYVLRTDSSIRERFEVRMDNSLRKTIQETSEQVLGILSGKEPVPCNNPRKCSSCGYQDSCHWNAS